VFLSNDLRDGNVVENRAAGSYGRRTAVACGSCEYAGGETSSTTVSLANLFLLCLEVFRLDPFADVCVLVKPPAGDRQAGLNDSAGITEDFSVGEWPTVDWTISL